MDRLQANQPGRGWCLHGACRMQLQLQPHWLGVHTLLGAVGWVGRKTGGSRTPSTTPSTCRASLPWASAQPCAVHEPLVCFCHDRMSPFWRGLLSPHEGDGRAVLPEGEMCCCSSRLLRSCCSFALVPAFFHLFVRGLGGRRSVGSVAADPRWSCCSHPIPLCLHVRLAISLCLVGRVDLQSYCAGRRVQLAERQ